MNTIDAIKDNLKYHDETSCDAVCSSWFTVIAVLADAYAEEGKTKEEVICRWIFRDRKFPKRKPDNKFFWRSDKWIERNEPTREVVPFGFDSRLQLGLNGSFDLMGCLDRLLAIPYQYLDRFR